MVVVADIIGSGAAAAAAPAAALTLTLTLTLSGGGERGGATMSSLTGWCLTE